MPPNNQQRADNQSGPGGNQAPFANYVTPEVISSPPARKKKLLIIGLAVLVTTALALLLLTFSGVLNLNPDQTRKENLQAAAQTVADFRQEEGYIPFDFELDNRWEDIGPDVVDPTTGERYELIILDESPELGQISYRKTADFDFEMCTKLESTEDLYCLSNPEPDSGVDDQSGQLES